jgi:argininosuccinate lyase
MAEQGLALTDARLGKPQSAALNLAVNAPGLVGEARMFEAFMAADLAHVVMLAEQGLVPPTRAKPLIQGLLELRAAGAGALPMNPGLGSLLLQVERWLEQRVGAEAAGMLQMARSRIDQNAAVARLYVRDGLLGSLRGVLALCGTLRDRATAWQDVIMPGYTHLQHAQPWVLGHVLLAQHDLFQRDFERLMQCYARVNLSAQGTAALSGTSWPVERDRVASLLGHAGLVENAKDAGVFAMEFLADSAGALSLLMSGLGRFASELYVWASWEFQLVDLDEGLCGTSSIMPQKKNPYALERVRALAGESIGWMPAQLGLLKTPTTTDCDLVFASGLHGSYFEATDWCTLLMRESVATMRVDRAHLLDRAGANWSTASSLADMLVRETELDFRRAHHVVAALVRHAQAARLRPEAVRSRDLDVAAEEILGRPLGLPDDRVRDALDPARFVATRVSRGSVAPAEVTRLLDRAAGMGAAAAAALQAEEGRLTAARSRLDAAARAFC